MVLCDGHRVENLGINLLIVEVNDVHLLTDALQGSLCAELGEVSAYVAVRLGSANIEIDIICELQNNRMRKEL